MTAILFAGCLSVLTVAGSGEETAADYRFSGAASLQAEDFEGAIPEFTRALELDLKDSGDYVNRALSKYLSRNCVNKGAGK